MRDQQIRIELTEAARSYVIDGGYDPVYGARPLKRFLQKNVETLSARLILTGEAADGSTIIIDADENGLQGKIKEKTS